ncbi:MAG TPA: hypothetical protein VG754_00240 [Verrucomicrobiae bacterium]|nr:hypothetical protein [Verrucomicrobiae bacterium]
MLLPTYILVLYGMRNLKQPSGEFRSRKGLAVLPLLLWLLRWQFLIGILSLALTWALIVTPHRDFFVIQADDAALTLNYLWPRSNVRLEWGEVSNAAIDRREFGIFRKLRFCLRVNARGTTYTSQWLPDRKEATRALDFIRLHVSNLQKGEIPPRPGSTGKIRDNRTICVQ